MAERLVVNEVFGPTFQGEGPATGERAVFLRLARCNLDCSWCDTAYTWDWTGKNGTVYSPAAEAHPTPLPEVAEQVERLTELGAELVVVTGGEPMLQQSALAALARYLVGIGLAVDIETNGTLLPQQDLTSAVRRYVVSPKLANSGVDRRRAIRPTVLLAYAATGKAVLKFVVQTAADVREAAEVVALVPDVPAYVMPEGRNASDVLAVTHAVADTALALGFRLTSRLHVLTWGDERGR